MRAKKNKYFVYFYDVYLNDVEYCGFAREEKAVYHAHRLAQSRPDAQIRVFRTFDVIQSLENISYHLWNVLVTDNLWLQTFICRVKGHKWDSDRPAGGMHERDFCWRCESVRTPSSVGS